MIRKNDVVQRFQSFAISPSLIFFLITSFNFLLVEQAVLRINIPLFSADHLPRFEFSFVWLMWTDDVKLEIKLAIYEIKEIGIY